MPAVVAVERPKNREHGDYATNVALQLGPYGAMLYRAAQIDAPARRAAATPAFSTEALPAVAPVVAKGEFVRAEMAGDAAAGWTAAATLTKGQVDTHLFLSFRFPQPIDLRGSDGLVLETTVPSAPQAGPELLVILRTAAGVDYLANTGRLLNAPGAARSLVLFGQFHRAGWSKAGPEAPDLSQVGGINAGWGGHYGAEGDAIALTVRPPQRFSCGLGSGRGD